MFLTYPDKEDPFATSDGSEQARMFALKFRSTDDVVEHCCVLSQAMCNIHGEDNRDKFCQLINIRRDSEVFETMDMLGERIFEWDTEEKGTWNISLMFAFVDDVDFALIFISSSHRLR
jgi:hypothetical protein